MQKRRNHDTRDRSGTLVGAVRRQRGQSLVLIALILPFLTALLLTAMEVGARMLELAEIEDALRQSARSAVQTFDYAAFAGNSRLLAYDAEVIAVGRASLITNLTSVRGLHETPEQTADRVVWTVLPKGGTCDFGPDRPSLVFDGPALCATLRPQLTGLLGWGVWSPQIDAAETLDQTQ